jgi:hypothetical protein
MIDIARALEHLGLTNWSVVEKDGKVTVTGIKLPPQEILDKAWAEVQALDAHREIEQARKARYEQETDPMLYDALAKLDIPELKEWRDKQKKIKRDLPKPV